MCEVTGGVRVFLRCASVRLHICFDAALSFEVKLELFES